MPTRSLFFDRVLPPLLATLALVTLGLVLFAAGVLLGLIPY